MKSVLITGANGFIGSHLADEALNNNYKVFAAVRASSDVTYLNNKPIGLIYLDFTSVEKLTATLVAHRQQHSSFDIVIHNAGTTRAKNDEDFFTINHVYTQNLIEALHKSQALSGGFVLMGSLAAFGPGNKQFTPIKKTDEYHPITAYGKSKMKAVLAVKNQNYFPYLIAYPTAVFGPRDKDFFEFIKLINSGFEPYIGLHRQMLSIVYVKDLVHAIFQLLNKEAWKQEFIVSDNIYYTKKDLGSSIKRALNKKALQLNIPLSLVMGISKAIVFFYKICSASKPLLTKEKVQEISAANWLADSGDLWQAIAAKPQYTLHEAMNETVQWYQQNGWLK